MFLRTLASLFVAITAAAPTTAQCTYVTFPGGSGCGNFTPWGIPVLSCNGVPSIGNTSFGFNTTAPCNSPATAGLLLVGVCLPAPVLITSGFGPGGVCGPSEAVCALLVSTVVIVIGTPQAGGFTFSTPVPNDPNLVGLQVCVQGANLCGEGCVGATNGMRATLF